MIGVRSRRVDVSGPSSPARLVPGSGRSWLQFAGVSGAYVCAAKVGLDLSVAHGVVTPVWAPSGIALAALVVFGRRFWPAVLLGAFISNATSGAGLLVAGAIALGNTLEAARVHGCSEEAGFGRAWRAFATYWRWSCSPPVWAR